MDLYLVRHTKTIAPPGICYGQSDILPASEDEMDAIAEKLRIIPFSTIYSSPLQRCKLLAEKISDKVCFDDRIKELNFGKWEMKHWNDLSGPEVNSWMNDFVNVPCPEGESYLQMEARVIQFWESVNKRSKRPTLIVTHGGVIRILMAKFRGIPLKSSFDIKVNYGQIERLNFFL